MTKRTIIFQYIAKNWLQNRVIQLFILTLRVILDLHGPAKSTGWTSKVTPAGITILVLAGKEQAFFQASPKA